MLARRAEERARQRSAARARSLEEALGWPAVRDAEISTTWSLRGERDGLAVSIVAGSPSLRRGLLRYRCSDWVSIVVAVPGAAAAPWTLRPPRRTVFEWRDGAPGEAPNHRTPAGAGLVLDGATPLWDERLERLERLVDGLAAGAWLVAGAPGRVELRAREPATDDVTACVRALLDRATAALAPVPGG